MAVDISKFAANLPGGGARPNLFEVIVPWPSKIGAASAGGSGSMNKLTFLCKAASMPASEVSTINIPYRGRSIYVAGVRKFEETWKTTIINDTDFSIRNALEVWQNAIHSHQDNIGAVNISDYTVDAQVNQLSHTDGKALRSYQFKLVWPSKLTAIEMAADSNDKVEEFDCEWAFSWWMVVKPNEISGDPNAASAQVITTT